MSEINTGRMESYEKYREACIKELEEEFEGFEYKEWILLRVPRIYRLDVISDIKRMYPQYKVDTYELEGIWVERTSWFQ